MPRKFIRRYLPSPQRLKEHQYLRIFGTLLGSPNLWHLNRRSVSGAVAVGLFWAFIPMPFQMVAAAATAIILRINLPIAVLMVWVSNPFTMPPLLYISYLVGSWLLDTPPIPHFRMSMEWISRSMAVIWRPLYFGAVVCGLLAAGLGFFIVRLLWRLHLLAYLKQRGLRLPSLRRRKSEENKMEQ